MAWIELHQAVWTHRKTFELAARLDLDETYAAAHLIRLWTWALDNAPTGDLSSLSARALAFGAGWRGDADALVAALVGSGWLDPDLRIHDWQDYAGRLLARREANAERMQKARAKDAQRTSGARAGATVPDLTVPDRTGPNPSLSLPSLSAARKERNAAGAADIPSDVIEQLSALPPDLDAGAFHTAAEKALTTMGFTCQREVAIPDRGDGHTGKIDLVAERHGQRIAFELDRISPRQKSIQKLGAVQGAARVVVLRAPFAGPVPVGLDAVIAPANPPKPKSSWAGFKGRYGGNMVAKVTDQ